MEGTFTMTQRAAGQYPGSRMQRRYEAWLDHARDCARCRRAVPEERCREGQRKWSAYQRATL